MEELTNKLEISAYIHCGECLKELPDGVSPKEWGQLEAGWTDYGLQLWCKRHECNVVHIDFEGHTHPADMTKISKPELKVV